MSESNPAVEGPPSGGRTKDVSEDAFWGRANDPLMPVIMAAQGAISAMREAAPE